MVWDPRVRNNGDSMPPKGVGHITINGTRHLIYSTEGPVGTVRWPGKGVEGPGACLLRVPGGRGGRVRGLTVEEIWRIQGGLPEEWARRRAEGATVADLTSEAARSLPRRRHSRW